MRSMTGFGRGEASSGRWRVVAEASGVNRKQRDISVSLPPSLGELEPKVRRRAEESVSRGRVNLRVSLDSSGEGQGNQLVLDRALARQYVEALRSLAEGGGVDLEIAPGDLIRAPGVFQVEDPAPPAEEILPALLEAVVAALAGLEAMQREEGGHLRRDLEARLETLLGDAAEIRRLAPGVVEQHRETLFSRLREAGLPVDLDDERVLREVALFAERCDISEELTRIGSHAAQFRRYLDGEEPPGRPLDFLCQELNRELNTIGSKANDAGIAKHVVQARTELEKIREQVQNVQ